MPAGNLTGFDIARFSRHVVDREEYNKLTATERYEFEAALDAAKAAVSSYTGVDVERSLHEDLAYAVKVIAAEMIDNRQITAQYTGKNPVAQQIMDLHSTNLLPSADPHPRAKRW